MNNFLWTFDSIFDTLLTMKTIKQLLAKHTDYVDTSAGAPAPPTSSRWWNDWAANNPTPQAKALVSFDPSDQLMQGLKGLIKGARSIEKN